MQTLFLIVLTFWFVTCSGIVLGLLGLAFNVDFVLGWFLGGLLGALGLYVIFGGN